MAKVYADKIRYEKINAKTGETWKLEDVPKKYLDEVIRILEG